MEELKTNAANLKTNVGAYIDTYLQLAKAKATQSASAAASGAVVGIAAALLGSFFFLFLFTGLAFWIGNLINSRAGGFLIIAAVFMLLLVLIFALRGKVITPLIRNSIIKKVYE